MDENMALTPYETREILFYKTDSFSGFLFVLLVLSNINFVDVFLVI